MHIPVISHTVPVWVDVVKDGRIRRDPVEIGEQQQAEMVPCTYIYPGKWDYSINFFFTYYVYASKLTNFPAPNIKGCNNSNTLNAFTK